MKLKYSLIHSLGIFSTLFLSASTWAVEYIVDMPDSFQAIWTKLHAGDTVILSRDLDVGALPVLMSHDFSVTIQSRDGNNFSLVWGQNKEENLPLPADVILNRVTLTGAPSTILLGKNPIVGTATVWMNNVGPLIRGTESISVGNGNSFRDNVATGNEHGAVIHAVSGINVSIKNNNVFSGNIATGHGGAIYLADRDKAVAGTMLKLDASEVGSSITFSGNTEEAVVEQGKIVDPGFANDIYFGKEASAELHAVEGASIVLGSGIASADETASITKTGKGCVFVADAAFYRGTLAVKEGSVTLAAGNVWGTRNGSASAPGVAVFAGASFVLERGASLASNLYLDGGTLRVSAPSALEGNLALGKGSSGMRFTLSQDLLADTGRTPLLSLSQHTAVTASPEGSVLVTDLDLTGVTSLGKAQLIQPYGNWKYLSEESRLLLSGPITYTDTTGTHLLDNVSIDPVTGLLDISSLVSKNDVRFDRPGTAAANALWSSVETLGVLRHTIGSQLNLRSAGKGNNVWGSGMASMRRVGSDGGRIGYRFNGGGYAVGVDRSISRSTVIGITLGQFFGTNRAEDGSDSDSRSKINQNSMMVGLYGQYHTSTDASNYWSMDVFAGYGATDNDLSSSSTNASWNDTNFAASLQVSRTYARDEGIVLRPFVGLDFLTGSQDSFITDGSLPLRYGGADMHILSLPVGCTLARTMEAGWGSFTPSLTVAYVADIFRDNPENQVTDFNDTTWRNHGSNPGRHAMRVKIGLERRWTSFWAGSVGYILNIRSQETVHSFTAGIQYSF